MKIKKRHKSVKNHFSKSKYCRLWQCPKMLWMDKYKPEEKAEDAGDIPG